MNKLKLSLVIGLILSLTIGLTVLAVYDPIASARSKNDLLFKELQSQQFKVKQEQLKEKEALKEYCLSLKETATLLLEESGEATKEQIETWKRLKERSCGTYYVNSLKDVYSDPSDLFYTFLKADGAYITQNIRTHFYRNGYAAVDIGTGGKKLTMYAPSYMKSEGEDLEREYTVELADFPKTTGRTMILHWNEDGVKMSFLLGHISSYLVQDGAIVKTGDKIAISGGDPTEDDQGATTGLHLHFEMRMNDVAVPYPSYAYTKHTKEDGNVEIEEKPVDLDKLAYAVAMAETGNCTKGSAISNKNCFGIMEWPNGKRQLKTYKDIKDSFKEFKEIWKDHYKTFPDYEMAKLWTGNDRPDTWLKAVTQYYNE
jgi:hypothetical protein